MFLDAQVYSWHQPHLRALGPERTEALLRAREGLLSQNGQPGMPLWEFLDRLSSNPNYDDVKLVVPHIVYIMAQYYFKSVTEKDLGQVEYPKNFRTLSKLCKMHNSDLRIPMFGEEIDRVLFLNGCPEGVRPDLYFRLFTSWREESPLPQDTAVIAWTKMNGVGRTTKVMDIKALKEALKIPLWVELSYIALAFAACEVARVDKAKVQFCNDVLASNKGDPSNERLHCSRQQLMGIWEAYAKLGSHDGIFVMESIKRGALCVDWEEFSPKESEWVDKGSQEEEQQSRETDLQSLVSALSGDVDVGTTEPWEITSTPFTEEDFVSVASFKTMMEEEARTATQTAASKTAASTALSSQKTTQRTEGTTQLGSSVVSSRKQVADQKNKKRPGFFGLR